MHDLAIRWPHSAQCAVFLTFDFDADRLWTSRDARNHDRPGVLSQGKYGAQVGVPKVLDTLRDAGVPATFFVPGWTAEHHTDRVEMILKGGHEVAHHSYSHRWVADDPEAEDAEIAQGMAVLQNRLGVTPRGYRSPAGEVSPALFALLKRYGIEYDSSIMDHINPYRHVLADGSPGVVELPWHWSLDDAPYVLFSIANPRPIMTNSHILEVWQDEFCEIYRWGGLYNLVMHPKVTGRPSRVALLRAMIAFMRRFPKVWFATGSQVMDAWVALGEATARPDQFDQNVAPPGTTI